MDARRISLDLISLTEVLAAAGHEVAAGILGGEYGYGAVFESAVFAMHPYCWCEQDTCPWCNVCLCGDGAVVYLIDGKPADDWDAWLDAPDSRRATLTDETKQCVRCRTGQTAAPNFLHKPSGTTVHWYKYIGRGMEVDLRGDWNEIITECRNSLMNPSTPSSPAYGAGAHDLMCSTPEHDGLPGTCEGCRRVHDIRQGAFDTAIAAVDGIASDYSDTLVLPPSVVLCAVKAAIETEAGRILP